MIVDMYILLRLLSFMYFFLQISGIRVLDLNNYGPYSITWRKVEICRNFKQSNSVNISANLFDDAKNIRKLQVNFTVSLPIQVDVIKISVYNEEDYQKKLLWHYNMKRPCEHFALSLLLTGMAKNKECIFNAEDYNIKAGLETIEKVIGDSFFYGTYNFRISLHSRKRNVICLSTIFTFNKISNVKIV